MSMTTEILKHTPTWVFAILAYLIYVGFQKTRTRIFSPPLLIVIPTIFVCLAARRLVAAQFAPATLTGMILGIAAAAILIWAIKPGRKVERLDDGRLKIHGEYVSLLFIIIIFTANYVNGFMTAVSPESAATLTAQIGFAFFNGLSAGFIVMRTAIYLRIARPIGRRNIA